MSIELMNAFYNISRLDSQCQCFSNVILILYSQSSGFESDPHQLFFYLNFHPLLDSPDPSA